jgi:hypothetical protein
MPKASNAAMIAANAELWSKAKIKPEWQASIDATARRSIAGDQGPLLDGGEANRR